jgi:hypothetical protein
MKKYLSYCSIDAEMEDLREFYDPDTVDLMQWIQQNTQQVRPLHRVLVYASSVQCTYSTVHLQCTYVLGQFAKFCLSYVALSVDQIN